MTRSISQKSKSALAAAGANSQVQSFEGEASPDKSWEVWGLQLQTSTTASDLQVIVTQAFARATSVMEICPKLANELFLLHSPTPGKPLIVFTKIIFFAIMTYK